MREKEYIDWLRGALSSKYIGDDAAVINIGGLELVFTTDLLVEGTHFQAGTDPRMIGRKAAAVSLSDIAAMGASPVCAVLSVCFRRGCGEDFARELLLGAGGLADEFGMEIVGGDTTSSDGEFSVSCAAIGRSPEGGAVRRGGARVGDVILVTGTLGGSLLGGHLEFVPRVREAKKILSVARPNAMIDISDGLACDLGHILEESGVGAVIVEEDVPVSDDLEHALHDGEDFELLMSVPADKVEKILDLKLECGVTAIGTITSGAGLNIRDESGTERAIETTGYEHAW